MLATAACAPIELLRAGATPDETRPRCGPPDRVRRRHSRRRAVSSKKLPIQQGAASNEPPSRLHDSIERPLRAGRHDVGRSSKTQQLDNALTPYLENHNGKHAQQPHGSRDISARDHWSDRVCAHCGRQRSVQPCVYARAYRSTNALSPDAHGSRQNIRIRNRQSAARVRAFGPLRRELLAQDFVQRIYGVDDAIRKPNKRTLART